jgi:hypothetical protein
MLEQDIRPGVGLSGALQAKDAAAIGGPRMKSIYRVECVGADGTLKWLEEIENTVVDAGLDDLLDKYFKGSSYTAGFFVGLKNTGSVAASDTMASHGDWIENTTYSNGTRPSLTLGAVAGQSVDNAAAKASFDISGTTTIFGAFVTTNATKGGTTGTLYGAADFASSRAVLSGDTLNVTVTLTAASA